MLSFTRLPLILSRVFLALWFCVGVTAHIALEHECPHAENACAAETPHGEAHWHTAHFCCDAHGDGHSHALSDHHVLSGSRELGSVALPMLPDAAPSLPLPLTSDAPPSVQLLPPRPVGAPSAGLRAPPHA